MNPIGSEAGYHDHRVVATQGSSGLRVDLVDAVKKRGVQHHQGEDDIRPIEGVVEYVRKIVSNLQMSECGSVADRINDCK